MLAENAVEIIIKAVLAICGGVTVILTAAGHVYKVVQAAKAPAKKVEERLAKLEDTVKEHKGYFANDKERLEAIEEGTKVTQKALLALLSHGIDGNDTEAMKRARDELNDYLIKR